MEKQNLYGYLSYFGKKSKANFPIRKRKITIGNEKTNDIRLTQKQPPNRQFLELSIRRCLQNEWNYTLDLCAFNQTVRENITIDNEKIFIENNSIQLKNGSVITIFGHDFKFCSNQANKCTKSASKIPVLKSKNHLLDLYSNKSCGWSSRKNSPKKLSFNPIDSAIKSKIPISATKSALIDANDLKLPDEECNDNHDHQTSTHDSTFDVDSDKSSLMKFCTPDPTRTESVSMNKSLRSLLKMTPQQSLTPNRKSVIFNEFVEEKHNEYDHHVEPDELGSFLETSPDQYKTLPDQNDSTLAPDNVSNEDNFVTINDNMIVDYQSQSPGNQYLDDSNVDFEVETLQQPKTPQADYETNVDFGIKKLQQPKTPQADYVSNIDFAVKKLQLVTPQADYVSNVDFAVKKLQQPKTPQADYETNVDFAVKKLQQPKTPQADYETNVDFAVKKLQQPTTPVADYETNIDFAVKKLQQPKTPQADYVSNVDFGIKKLQQPKTPLADYETNVDFAVKKLQQSSTPIANYEKNIDFGIKKLQQPTTPIADYETNIDFGIKKLQQPRTPQADYVSKIDFGIKRLQRRITPLPEYDDNFDGLENLFAVDDNDINLMITPIKPKARGRRPKQKIENSENRMLTRSAHKKKIKNEEQQDEQLEEKLLKSKKQSTGVKRRRKAPKDEIGQLIDSDDESTSDQVDIEKIRELAEIYSKKSNNHNVDQFHKRSRGRGPRKQSSTASMTNDDDELQTIDIMELDDNQLIDAMNERSSVTNGKRKTAPTRKRKTTTINKTCKSNESDDHLIDDDCINQQENQKNVASCQPQRMNNQKKCRIILPDVDFSMRLECNDSNEQTTKAKVIMTRSRAKRIH
ncbi:hypothetical protein DERP_007515 [Dermatophagoides pteronyssinus]|uniref:FHA domain-containing protein n=1 Tax=Dermatophagoides pteronyssinus TaxID=6956 RepID=A0ABQ8J4J9_DERPT|nr:hypothetical protein DERP_007515 [Dermatophagoides pteronyssinus]